MVTNRNKKTDLVPCKISLLVHLDTTCSSQHHLQAAKSFYVDRMWPAKKDLGSPARDHSQIFGRFFLQATTLVLQVNLLVTKHAHNIACFIMSLLYKFINEKNFGIKKTQ